MKKQVIFGLVAVIVACLFTVTAQAGTLTIDYWSNITNNTNSDLGDQLILTIYDAEQANEEFSLSDGPNELTVNDVLFTFVNDVGIASNVMEIYFDNGDSGPLTSLLNVFNDLGTSGPNFFAGNTAPPGLPGGDNLNPPFTVDFSVDSFDNQGLNSADQILGISFSTNGGLNAIADALATEELRIGLHVGSIGGNDGDSDSYVVPEPSFILLLGLGVGVVGLAERRIRKY